MISNRKHAVLPHCQDKSGGCTGFFFKSVSFCTLFLELGYSWIRFNVIIVIVNVMKY